jgi:AraC-like DNA-binding protein
MLDHASRVLVSKVLGASGRLGTPRPTLAGRVHVQHHDSVLGRWLDAACLPSPDLARYVLAIWYGEGRLAYLRDRILPRACAHLLINLGPPEYLVDDRTGERRPFRDIWFSGQHQTYIDTEAPEGVAILGVSFRAEGAYAVTASEQEPLAEQVVSLADLAGDGVLALRQRLLETVDLFERFALVEAWLLERAARGRDAHAATRWAVDRIAQCAGRVRIEELARSSGYSRKHLATLFRREVGLTPKALARVHRFHAALASLRAGRGVGWAELAADCGYYDQSHLIRDFRAFSGCTPEELVATAAPDAFTLVVG